MSKYYEENCLMQMEFVKEKGVSVEQHVAAVAKELGGKIAVKSFVRFERGEGIEKKQRRLRRRSRRSDEHGQIIPQISGAKRSGPV